MSSFNVWYSTNKYALIYLYDKLFSICEYYNIYLINNRETFYNFLNMMFHESKKELIDKKLFPEFFNNGYEKYKITDIFT